MARILVLDDVEDQGILVRRILERKGHQVDVFSEEEEALAHARAHGVDLAILDIKLKRLSGVEVLEELKALDPTLKAIMLTGYPTMETAENAARLGADGYCVKPIDMGELEAKVAEVLEK